MLDTALAYLAHGWSIFPLRPRSKVPAVPSWKQFMQEKPTEALVRTWWRNNPNFNIAIATGFISGIFVVDCDSWELVKVHEALPDYVPTLRSKTANGVHFVYQLPGFRVGNRAGDGVVHIRGDGGYICAPPSIHPSGVRYQWIRDAIQCPPQAIVELCKPELRTPQAEPKIYPPAAVRGSRYAQTVFDREYSNVISAQEHGRNNQLNRSAYNLGQLCGDGLLNRYDVENALAQAAMAAGLPESEALRTIASGLNAGIGNPRSLRGR